MESRAAPPCARARARAPSNLGHYNRAVDSHSREFALLPPASPLRLDGRCRKKPRIAAGSRGNQINFSVNLPASCRPQTLAFNDVISLADSRGNANNSRFLRRFADAKHARDRFNRVIGFSSHRFIARCARFDHLLPLLPAFVAARVGFVELVLDENIVRMGDEKLLLRVEYQRHARGSITGRSAQAAEVFLGRRRFTVLLVALRDEKIPASQRRAA